MQLSTLNKTLLSLGLFLTLAIAAQAQGNIQAQFDQFYETETSSWQDYKLIKKPRLKEFWTVVADTIKVKEGKIASARAEVKSLKGELVAINKQLAETQSNLAASEERNDSIEFIGIQMSKSGYNTLVWLIIAALAIGIVSLYLLYLRNNSTTKEARRLLAKVEEEYATHQEKARENQTKLKRELQTALNTLQEHRIKI
ncbi:hypothetical protein N7E81_11105 [Reichenbachiella carrageenanivorans]|uniref:tRNA (Guanine-N1)-methyltransferase n=1 Tax=Reichenbachiella carrageenanivorans TaxID=2979869 RepID=A0ABY6CX44_9BACT|nr:hypothetical protein [Reichenbachiella carrageenanivorans]UXX77914.1 hypothetical protein N7E81_11105 [Reichenbachiella carrageenanivorans]